MREKDVVNFLSAALHATAAILNVTRSPVVLERTRVVERPRRTVRVYHTEISRRSEEYILERLEKIENKLENDWWLLTLRERSELREEKRELQRKLGLV